MGDQMQSIYKFREADSRFITLASKIFNINNKNWSEYKLSTSYRVTDKIATFINECVLLIFFNIRY